MKRLNPDAEMFSEIFQYYKTREMQAKPYGYILKSVTNMSCFIEEKGITFPYALAEFSEGNNKYFSFYMPKQFRNKGYGEYYAEEIRIVTSAFKGQVITFPDCNFSEWLNKNGIEYTLLDNTYIDLPEYIVMSKEYGDSRANRSGLYLMNHIDEGADIMISRKASEQALRAFIAHPMLQDDDHFFDIGKLPLNKVMVHCSKYTLMLCMEYRKVANAYLCKPETDGWTQEQIKFHCPILMHDIREMLIADKVQNYKDFLQFHALSHPRRNELFAYFNNWIDYLGCSSFANHWINKQNITVKLPVNY